MIMNRPAVHEPGPAELPLPTEAAQLTITAERMKGVSAQGTVPPADARYLITTFGIMASVATSTAGADLILRAGAIAPHAAPYIALADLALGLVATILIAICGLGQRRGRSRMPAPERDAGGPGPSGEGRSTTTSDF